MNDDLKAYVDGELPPDAAERLRRRLEGDPDLLRETEAMRDLSASLKSLPQVRPLGRETALAAINRRRPSLALSWGFALSACTAVVVVAFGLSHRNLRPVLVPAELPIATAPSREASIPAVRREAFIRFVRDLGGEVRRDGDGLRAFYPESSHDRVIRRFLLPNDLPWPADGLRVRLAP